MTSKIQPRTCDFCGHDIESEKAYRAQISERTKKGDYKEPTMVQCDRDADMCHTCFLEICKNGFEAKWKQIVKPDHGGKWITIEERDEQRRKDMTQEKLPTDTLLGATTAAT